MPQTTQGLGVFFVYAEPAQNKTDNTNTRTNTHTHTNPPTHEALPNNAQGPSAYAAKPFPIFLFTYIPIFSYARTAVTTNKSAM